MFAHQECWVQQDQQQYDLCSIHTEVTGILPTSLTTYFNLFYQFQLNSHVAFQYAGEGQ